MRKRPPTMCMTVARLVTISILHKLESRTRLQQGSVQVADGLVACSGWVQTDV